MKKRESLIICGPDNVKEFNKRLKSELPGFFVLVKNLHKEGMINGLRGAKIEDISINSREQVKTAHIEEKRQCRHCQAFIEDKVGDGQGIGHCIKNIKTRRSKYPRTIACDEYQSLLTKD